MLFDKLGAKSSYFFHSASEIVIDFPAWDSSCYLFLTLVHIDDL